MRSRGVEPIRLTVRPAGAEIAHPVKALPLQDKAPINPDPDAKIHRDKDGLIEVETALVPGTVGPGKSARVHIVLRPNAKQQIHWNNEAEPVRL